MNVIIDEKNRERIEKILNGVERRCTVRTLDFVDLVRVVGLAKKHIQDRCGTIKKNLAGAKVCYSPNGKFSSGYKYPAKGTQVVFTFGKDGKARLENVERGYISMDRNQQFVIHYTDYQLQLIKHDAMYF